MRTKIKKKTTTSNVRNHTNIDEMADTTHSKEDGDVVWRKLEIV